MRCVLTYAYARRRRQVRPRSPDRSLIVSFPLQHLRCLAALRLYLESELFPEAAAVGLYDVESETRPVTPRGACLLSLVLGKTLMTPLRLWYVYCSGCLVLSS